MISDELASKLREAAKVPLTPKMIYEQRVSWIIGQQHGREVTRAEVVRVLDELGILDPERLDAALAGKDAELHPALQMALGNHSIGVFKGGKLIAADADVYMPPKDAEQKGAAPGLPEEPEIFKVRRQRRTCRDGVNDLLLSDETTEYVEKKDFDAWKSFYLRAVKERDEASERDAKRYRWLRDTADLRFDCGGWVIGFENWLKAQGDFPRTPDDEPVSCEPLIVDAAIDAAAIAAARRGR